MLYGYFISYTINAKIGPLFYFTLSAESLYSRLHSLLRKLPTEEKGGQTYPLFRFWYKLIILFYCYLIQVSILFIGHEYCS